MAQIENGFKHFLSLPNLYNLFQWLVGAPNIRKRMVQFGKIQPAMRILDLGCGPGSLLDYLPTSIHYYGIDLNEKYISFATKKFPNHSFMCKDVCQINTETLPKFDVIFALGLLHHLDDAQGFKLLSLCAKLLDTGGRLLTLDGCYTPQQSWVAKYLLQHDRGQNVRTEENYNLLATQHFKHVKCTISHEMLHIPYTHLIMNCSNS
jgi:cyclopropane fatty-acyl-phospholipid synthase-like methyltransferase